MLTTHDVLKQYEAMTLTYILQNTISVRKTLCRELPLHCADKPFSIAEITQEYVFNIDKIIKGIVEKENLSTDEDIIYQLEIHETVVSLPDNANIFKNNKFNMYAILLTGTKTTLYWGRFRLTITFTIYENICNVPTKILNILIEYKDYNNNNINREICINSSSLKLKNNKLLLTINDLIDNTVEEQVSQGVCNDKLIKYM